MEETENKMKSRKFVVWITWGIITLIVIAISIITIFVTKKSDSPDLIEKVLSYFFGVSMLYLGVNVGQKIGLSFFNNKNETDEKDESSDTDKVSENKEK